MLLRRGMSLQSDSGRWLARHSVWPGVIGRYGNAAPPGAKETR